MRGQAGAGQPDLIHQRYEQAAAAEKEGAQLRQREGPLLQRDASSRGCLHARWQAEGGLGHKRAMAPVIQA